MFNLGPLVSQHFLPMRFLSKRIYILRIHKCHFPDLLPKLPIHLFSSQFSIASQMSDSQNL